MNQRDHGVLPGLASLAELCAQLGRAEDLTALGAVVARSTKWVLTVDHASLVVIGDGDGTGDGTGTGRAHTAWPGGTTIEPRGALALALEREATVRTVVEDPVADVLGVTRIRAWMVVPLRDADVLLGALVLGVRDPDTTTSIDSGLCHLLALNIASALRAVRLLRRERDAILSRDRMIAAVTHDLRNPLSVATAMAGLLAEDAPPEQAQDFEDIAASLARMKDLADELLDIAQLQTNGTLELHRVYCDLNAIVRRASAVGRMRVELALSPTPLGGELDGPRLARVFDNLMGNAVKYSPAGGAIRVSSERVVRDDGRPWAIVRVADAGIGIPAADLARVFAPFQRASNVGAIKGTGIGLATTREIVVRHGGDITVESTVGEGSTFTIALPL